MTLTIKQQQIIKFTLLCLLSVLGLALYFFQGGTWLKALLFYLIFGIVAKVANVAYHRWLAHKLVKPGVIGTWFFLWCIVSSFLVKPLEYVAGHRMHHKHSDSDNDPHSTSLGFWNCLIGNFKVPERMDVSIADTLRNKEVMFVQKYYYSLWALNLMVFWIIDPQIVLLSFALLNMRMLVNVTVFNYFAHGGKKLKQPVNMPAWTGWMLGYVGEQLHKNHHDRPNDSNFGKVSIMNFDITYYIIKKFMKVRQ